MLGQRHARAGDRLGRGVRLVRTLRVHATPPQRRPRNCDLIFYIVDIDHFKDVNDEHGHAAGDRVLAAVANSMRVHLRAEDQLGRLGGEEFLALLPDADAAAAAAAAEKLRAEVATLAVEHEGRALAVTISAGWAAWEEESPDELLRRADEALYEAKRAGRDRVEGAPATVQRRT